MTNLQSRVDALWRDLEDNYRPTLTASDDHTLRQLDADAIDRALTEAAFERVKRSLMINRRRSYNVEGATGQTDPAYHAHRVSRSDKLFGDYELVINTCLGGDPAVKAAVLKADNDGRRGLASLKYHLRKAKAHIPQDIATILRTCEADQEYHDDPIRQAAASKPDMRNIEKRSGGFRVSIMVDGERHRETFGSLEEARSYRDRMTGPKVRC